MVVITEDYVSFKIAKLLKEKGFDVPCFAYYYVMPHKTVIAYDKDFPKNSDLCLIYANMEFGSIPTLQMAMKWLREVHKIYIDINIRIILEQWAGYNINIYKTNTNNCLLGKVISLKGLKDNTSYTQACEAAIKYCLKNLI